MILSSILNSFSLWHMCQLVRQDFKCFILKSKHTLFGKYVEYCYHIFMKILKIIISFRRFFIKTKQKQKKHSAFNGQPASATRSAFLLATGYQAEFKVQYTPSGGSNYI